MSRYVLSKAADADIENIIRYTLEQWGPGRAEFYLTALHGAFETLCEFPHLGRDIAYLRTDYFQFEYESHCVFYQKTKTGIFIARILHKKQLPENYL
jgi:toxin ParE1/3/4